MADKLQLILDKALAYMILRLPFFGTAVSYMPLIETGKIPTTATDGRNIYYNANFLGRLEFLQVVACLVHEVLHPVLGCFWRRQWREHGKWNRADDYANNPIITELGLPLPEGALFDRRYIGMNSEAIYPLLPDEGGSGCHCVPCPPELSEEHGDGQGPPELDADLQQEWQTRVERAAYTARQTQGLGSPSLERIIQGMLDRHIPWYQYMYNWMDKVAPDDYTWQIPNRRHIGSNIYLPSLSEPRMGTMIDCIDTSGSIGEKTVGQFGHHVNVCRTQVRPLETHVMYIDDRIQGKVQVYGPDESITWKAKGRGGTDFRPAFKYADQLDEEPACLVYFTDLYGTFPKNKPSYPVLWVATSDKDVPFGDVVRITDKDVH